MQLTRLIPFIPLLCLAGCQPQGAAIEPASPAGLVEVSAASQAEQLAPGLNARVAGELALPTPTPPPASTVIPPEEEITEVTGTEEEFSVPQPARPCPVAFSGGLISELRPILAAIPGPGTEGMRVPSDPQLIAWEYLLRSIDSGDTETACEILHAFDFPYTLLDFTDTPAGGARYLALVEDIPVTFGWGAYVVRTGEAKAELVIQAPHPIADDRTALQAADLFRRLEARALMIAGAHRCANSDYSPCSGVTVACGALEPYRSSDVAHAVQSAFQAAHKALVPCGGERTAVQLHGNGLESCPDLFISNGTLNPRRMTLELYQAASKRCTGFSVDLADSNEGECAFNGGATVQALWSNGCALVPPVDACEGFAEIAPEREGFIFLEQSERLRREYGCLVKALEE
jgi:hypothetical protein